MVTGRYKGPYAEMREEKVEGRVPRGGNPFSSPVYMPGLVGHLNQRPPEKEGEEMRCLSMMDDDGWKNKCQSAVWGKGKKKVTKERPVQSGY